MPTDDREAVKIPQSKHQAAHRSWTTWSLVVLQKLFVILVILSAASLLVDWHPWGKRRGRFAKNPAPTALPSQRPTTLPAHHPKESVDLLMKQYEHAVKEIHDRLGQESGLFALKFTLVGAVLLMVFGAGRDRAVKDRVIQRIPSSPPAAVFFWVAVTTSGIVDTRILFHVGVIVTLGQWIRAHVEPVMLGNWTTGWETFVPDSDFFSERLQIYPLLRLNVLLLTLLLFTVALCIFFWRPTAVDPKGATRERLATDISCGGAFVSLGVFFLTGIHYHYGEPAWIDACRNCLFAGWLFLGFLYFTDRLNTKRLTAENLAQRRVQPQCGPEVIHEAILAHPSQFVCYFYPPDPATMHGGPPSGKNAV